MSKDKLTISDDVLNKIRQGEVHMKPRLYYSMLSALSLIAVLIAGLAVSYLLSVAFYWVRIETASTMAYGARRNLSESLAAFPWWIVLAAIGLVVLAVVLVRKHGRMYRHKPHTVALAIIAGALLVGLLFYAVGIGGLGKSHNANPDSGRRGPNFQQNL